MPDNITAPGAGAVLATDEIGGVHYPRTKLAVGNDGTATDVSATNRLPVSLPAGFATDDKLDALIAAVGDASGSKQDAQTALLAAIDAKLGLADYYPDTQPVSIAGTIAVSGSLTDEQLRATAVPVSIGDPVAITAAALPLPAGAATSTKQDDAIAATGKLGSAKRWFAITPDNGADLATVPDAIRCNGDAGNVVLRGDDAVDVTFYVAKGETLPCAPTRVLATGTTATGLVGIIA